MIIFVGTSEFENKQSLHLQHTLIVYAFILINDKLCLSLIDYLHEHQVPRVYMYHYRAGCKTNLMKMTEL